MIRSPAMTSDLLARRQRLAAEADDILDQIDRTSSAALHRKLSWLVVEIDRIDRQLRESSAA